VGLAVYLWDDAILERLRNLGEFADSTGGVLVRGVMPGGAAEAAGLRSTRSDEQGNIEWGDLIVAIDGQEIRKASDLHQNLAKRKANDSIKITYLRDGQKQETDVVLRPLPSLGE
jgi:S1-C subfamily serine protease